MAIPNPLSSLFGKSPITPIQEHMATAHKAVGMLYDFFAAANAGDWEKAADIRLEISKCEGHADTLKRDIRMSLPKSMFLPVPRTDLLELLGAQDKMANRAKDIAGIMLGRQMSLPVGIEDEMLAYVDTSIATCAQALKAIEELDELLEMGFSGRELLLVEKLIDELDRLEHENDRLQITIRSKLFAIEKDLPPIDVMFLYRIIEWVGDLSDRAQNVGSKLQLLLAR